MFDRNGEPRPELDVDRAEVDARLDRFDGDDPSPPQTPIAGSAPRPRSGLVPRLAVVGLLGILAFKLLGSEKPWDGPETEAPAYAKHRDASAGTLARNDLHLSRSDADRGLTREVAAAAAGRGAIPGDFKLTRDGMKLAAQGKLTYFKVRLFDTCAEDGDIVSLSVGGVATSGPVTITHGGTIVSIPLPDGGAPAITLHAIHDGVGGVTVGAQCSDGTWYSDVLPEGASQIITAKGP